MGTLLIYKDSANKDAGKVLIIRAGLHQDQPLHYS